MSEWGTEWVKDEQIDICKIFLLYRGRSGAACTKTTLLCMNQRRRLSQRWTPACSILCVQFSWTTIFISQITLLHYNYTYFVFYDNVIAVFFFSKLTVSGKVPSQLVHDLLSKKYVMILCSFFLKLKFNHLFLKQLSKIRIRFGSGSTFFKLIGSSDDTLKLNLMKLLKLLLKLLSF